MVALSITVRETIGEALQEVGEVRSICDGRDSTTLQDGLSHAAKNEKDWKFCTLYDKICRIDILEDEWKRVSANGGSPGIDRKSIEDIESYDLSRFLGEIQHELMNMTYRVPNVKRVYIPKQDGKKRPPRHHNSEGSGCPAGSEIGNRTDY